MISETTGWIIFGSFSFVAWGVGVFVVGMSTENWLRGKRVSNPARDQISLTAGVLWPVAAPLLPVLALWAVYAAGAYLLGGLRLARGVLLPAPTIPAARLVRGDGRKELP